MKKQTVLEKHNNYKLNIALVIKNFVATGGAERYAVEVARRILKKGHRIDLYAKNIDKSLTKGMNVFKVPDRLKFSSALSLYSFSKDVSKLLADKKYDVIHSHDKGCEGHVSTLHTFSYKKGMEKMSLIKKLNEFGLSPRAWLYIHMEKKQANLHMLAAVSEIIKNDVKTYYKRTNDVFVITPGVDIEKFSPQRIAVERSHARESENLKPDDIAVLFVGSEFRRKGLDRLIPAIGDNMKLFVVGRQEHMGHYRHLVKQYNLSDRICFTGLTDNIIKYYALSDIVVLPSISEAFGMTILEGMACGLPVVTSSSTGCSFLIDTGKNGFVFQNQRELAGILNTLKDKDIRKRIGNQAGETAQKHTWDKTARHYEELYYHIANANLPQKSS
ncbi:glycosyltransferase family 4 protein [Desulfobacula sp.]|uniref:glycosyltransferase family 4 protein n=1 Tax=Desulfobacula sp. TaxID=2593537 RepID=UPI00263836F4|nr:glycosyltransferase family 4 protein [Desulfobacula sp.]